MLEALLKHLKLAFVFYSHVGRNKTLKSLYKPLDSLFIFLFVSILGIRGTNCFPGCLS